MWKIRLTVLTDLLPSLSVCLVCKQDFLVTFSAQLHGVWPADPLTVSLIRPGCLLFRKQVRVKTAFDLFNKETPSDTNTTAKGSLIGRCETHREAVYTTTVVFGRCDNTLWPKFNVTPGWKMLSYLSCLTIGGLSLPANSEREWYRCLNINMHKRSTVSTHTGFTQQISS